MPWPIVCSRRWSCGAAVGGRPQSEYRSDPEAPVTISLSSPEFGDELTIPRRFTCDGEDRSPPLQWRAVPDDAVELALLVDVVRQLDGTTRAPVAWDHFVGVSTSATG